jgi:hypothetical protein
MDADKGTIGLHQVLIYFWFGFEGMGWIEDWSLFDQAIQAFIYQAIPGDGIKGEAFTICV